jgi:UDP-N-acetylglucosamine--N-acetylmuramyl-(pentapeptide) pyrophosphoryl-undecaprenol N-acetylglucosamine transferase
MTGKETDTVRNDCSETDATARNKGMPLRIAIAAGGTGGHLFPGIAIGQAFMTRSAANAVLFVSIGKPFEKTALAKAGFPLERITSAALKGQGLWGGLKAMLKLPRGVYESVQILRRFKPHMVLGLGSYTSAPLILSAWLMRIPIGLHEQNILPGLTNRILAPLADRIFVSFENTRFTTRCKKSQKVNRKIDVTGNPVRREILQAAMVQENFRPADTDEPRVFTVLIIGGSQGAHRINKAMADAGRYIKEKKNFFFVHQTGQKDREETEAAYKKNNIACTVAPFFEDMAQKYRQADLVVSRAGATTVAEITALGKGSIFIPYPYAADDHQTINARNLVREGAAEMISDKDIDGKILSGRIAYYGTHREELAAMASNAKNFGKPDAAERIVDGCYDMLAKKIRD